MLGVAGSQSIAYSGVPALFEVLGTTPDIQGSPLLFSSFQVNLHLLGTEPPFAVRPFKFGLDKSNLRVHMRIVFHSPPIAQVRVVCGM